MVKFELSSRRRLAGLVTLVVLFVSLAFATEGGELSESTKRWVEYIGRFHPVVLHLPIGLFFALFILEVIGLRAKSAGFGLGIKVLVVMTAVSSLAAAILGLLLAANGDYAGGSIWWHKWLGVIFTVGAMVLVYLKFDQGASKGGKAKGKLAVYRFCVLGLFGLLPVVGHLGGNLTHGEGYLSDLAPSWLGGKDSAKQGSDKFFTEASEDEYVNIIEPIFKEYCVKCHGANKQSSKYRMDTYEAMMTPGRSGELPVVAFDMAKSPLLQFMLLPQSAEMVMPPEGKASPSAEEILMVSHWIARGAKGPAVDEAELERRRAELEAREAEMTSLLKYGVTVMRRDMETDYLVVDFQNAKQRLGGDVWNTLAKYKDQMAELNLAGQDIEPAQLAMLSGAQSLERLNLTGLQSADEYVETINSFDKLEHLILFDSDLSDTGLGGLSVLKEGSLFIGQTAISAEYLKGFINAHAGMKVYGDVELDDVRGIEEISASNSSLFNPGEKKKAGK